MPLSPARRAAFDILRRVEDESAYASSLLATLDERLRDDDRALCHELVLGVLRRQLWLDCVLEHFAKRRLEKSIYPSGYRCASGSTNCVIFHAFQYRRR